MKILYGVQGTGNGHITRARAMAPALAQAGIEVDYLFSGRDPDKYFDMAPFGDYRTCAGLTFATRNGKVSVLRTMLDMEYRQFFHDVSSLDLSGYDLVLTDYEPVTAWAGRKANIKVIGTGHQYAFDHPIPQRRASPLRQWIMHRFAPVDVGIGFHWHHFGYPILPPLAPVEEPVEQQDFVLVYLPFESLEAIDALLQQFPEQRFHVYHPELKQASTTGKVCYFPPSRDGFQHALSSCSGVIGNAGFELSSEAINLGKKLLVKPLKGQPEQYSNVIALNRLGLGNGMNRLCPATVAGWLENGVGVRVVYPDVASALALWLATAMNEPLPELAARLWQQVEFPNNLTASASLPKTLFAH